MPFAVHPHLVTWNNRIGCVKGFSTVSVFHFFDKSFYRNRIGIIVEWGFTAIPFIGVLNHFNNKVTSYMHTVL